MNALAPATASGHAHAPAAPLEPPLAILAELTHRCPLQCPYCSNPTELERANGELDTASWLRVIAEAADLGVLHVHFSGGEPTARKDLEPMLERARARGLYTNLITSAVLLNEKRLKSLADAGLAHVQISIQDSVAESADRIAGYAGAHQRKQAVAAMVRALDLPLTVNAVVHRQNLERLGDMIELAVKLGAQRLEVAHVQYYGWALHNRAALMPRRAQLDAATRLVQDARERLKGVLVIDYVVPDYYARRPKACMGGWARRFMNITPSGKALPCHAAESIPGLEFDSVRDHDLRWIWENSAAFRRYRGTDWMPELCLACDRREIDWGGCRCQAFAILGDADATDPACGLSPRHGEIVAAAEKDSTGGSEFDYRNFANAGPSSR